jgi:hypothetical protein
MQIDLTTRLVKGMPTTSESNFQKDPGNCRQPRTLGGCIELCRDNVNKEVDEIFTCG